jgi:transcription elongation factor Elf1
MEKKFNIVIKNKRRTVHENIKDHGKVECPICNREIIPYWEPRYNGIRATCDICGINWQES